MRDGETNTDGERLQRQFDFLKAKTGMKKAEFARVFKVPGGASMISQHISGHRPIGLDAIVAYTKGFECSVFDISPTLAAQLPQSGGITPDYKQNNAIAPVDNAQAAIESVATLEQITKALAGYLREMSPKARHSAASALRDLTDDPEEHEFAAAMLQTAFHSGKRKAA